VLVPLLIFVACFSVGVVASAQWLPPLADEVVGGLAFFAVCGLLGAALGLIGLHIYSIVESLDHFGGGIGGIEKGQIFASGVESMTWEAASTLGLACVVYLLSPSRS
jgi:ABC-type amino acid transport system permease subunit